MKAVNNQYRFNSLLTAFLLAAIGFGLSACGKSEGDKATQTLATVNGVEITVHQLNEELARSNTPPAQQEQAKKQILESLIDRQVLETAATKAKLDRDPNVMQAITRAKSQILAQAYVQGVMANVQKATKTEIEDFYKQNPGLFSERKLVEMKQLLIDSRAVSDQFRDAIKNSKSLDEVANWLDGHGVQYDRGEISRNLAEMPKELATRIQEAKTGQLFVINMGNRTMLIMVDSLKSSPVPLAEATPVIDQILMNQKRKSIAESELLKLRNDAKIEYSNPAEAPAPKSAAEPKKETSTSVNSDVEHGASGLR